MRQHDDAGPDLVGHSGTGQNLGGVRSQANHLAVVDAFSQGVRARELGLLGHRVWGGNA